MQPEFTTEELATEEWRDVPDYPGYQVSNIGRVKKTRVIILKPHIDDYARVTLYRGKQSDGDVRHFGIHQLVARLFIGPRPEGKFPNHQDGNKLNNRLGNLTYMTPSENSLHAIDMGLSKARGSDNVNAKLSEPQAKEIIQRLANGESDQSLAQAFGITNVMVSFIRQGRAWKHIERPVSSYLGRLPYPGHPQGPDSPNAKVSTEEVRTIRELYATGQYRMQDLADTFGIGKTQTKRIIDHQSRRIA